MRLQRDLTRFFYNQAENELCFQPFSIAIPDSSLAAIGQLSENSRLGFASRNPALYQGSEWWKSTLALGLPQWSGVSPRSPRFRACLSEETALGLRVYERFAKPDKQHLPCGEGRAARYGLGKPRRDAVSLTDAQRAELDYRIARREQDPSAVIPWEQVRAGLFNP